MLIPTPAMGLSLIISHAQCASSTRVSLDAWGACTKRSMILGMMATRPIAAIAAMGIMRLTKTFLSE